MIPLYEIISKMCIIAFSPLSDPFISITFSLTQPAQALFSTDAALYELFKYTVQYSDDTVAALREHDLSDQALLFQTIAETLK